MIRSLARSLLAATVLACAAVFDHARDFGRALANGVGRFVLAAPPTPMIGVTSPRTSAPLLIQARAYVMRIAKRERPVLSTSWRMCPSC